MKELSTTVIIIGIVIILIGVLIRYTPLLKYFGRLPGDIRIEKDSYKFYFPLTSLIILSLLISLIIRIFRK